ncbi:MAG: hypothetical protein ABIG34_04480 [Candidatus Peregrinibacteria bacterium]
MMEHVVSFLGPKLTSLNLNGVQHDGLVVPREPFSHTGAAKRLAPHLKHQQAALFVEVNRGLLRHETNIAHLRRIFTALLLELSQY